MFLRSKEIAFTGIMMAAGVLLVLLGGFFEGSTLFFLAAASFLTGIVFRCISPGTSLFYVAGTSLLGIILSPQKLYLATFLAFSIYILGIEYMEKAFAEKETIIARGKIWVFKAVLYHLLLGISVFLVQKFFGLEGFFRQGILAKIKDYQIVFVLSVVVLAELFWLIFDRAYVYFQKRYGDILKRIGR